MYIVVGKVRTAGRYNTSTVWPVLWFSIQLKVSPASMWKLRYWDKVVKLAIFFKPTKMPEA